MKNDVKKPNDSLKGAKGSSKTVVKGMIAGGVAVGLATVLLGSTIVKGVSKGKVSSINLTNMILGEEDTD